MSIRNLKIQLKKIALQLLILLNMITKFLPSTIFFNLSKFIILLSTYSNNPKKDLILLFKVKDEVEKIINNRALSYGHGEHPKHYLTNYHEFFVNNIADGENVIDIGCGYGSVSRSIARANPNSKILGIDNDRTRLQQATASDNPTNLSFIYGDVTQHQFDKKWDVIVLSNVLEHIEYRIEFLLAVKSNTQAKKFLIRVPSYERDWQVPLRDQFNINYFTDSDHKIEHKLLEFCGEINQARLEITELVTSWGEIWAVCIPANK